MIPALLSSNLRAARSLVRSLRTRSAQAKRDTVLSVSEPCRVLSATDQKSLSFFTDSTSFFRKSRVFLKLLDTVSICPLYRTYVWPPDSAIVIESLKRRYSPSLAADLAPSSSIASLSPRPTRSTKPIVSSSAPATRCAAICPISLRNSGRCATTAAWFSL